MKHTCQSCGRETEGALMDDGIHRWELCESCIGEARAFDPYKSLTEKAIEEVLETITPGAKREE